MSAASKMWQQPTFEVLPNATSSQGSLFGPTLFDWPAGPTSESAGPEAVPAPVSPVRAKEAGLMTLVTSGRNFIGSSASASLQQSLESSLRTRLDTAGGTLYRLTWKVRHTPLRRRFLVRRVLEVQTRDIACTLSGWPTPNTPSGGPNTKSTPKHTGGMDLEGAATLCQSFATDAVSGNRGSTGVTAQIPMSTESAPDCRVNAPIAVTLAGWPT